MLAGKWNINLLEPSFAAWQPNKPVSKQIAVLMSGGVDSSVTAHILKEQGWEVLGVTIKIPVVPEAKCRRSCGVDAAFVCRQLEIPHYFIDVTEAFQKLIIESFRQSYAEGKTPSPCADCNTFLKFSLVWDFVQQNFGIDYLATGHYARVTKTNGQACLKRAANKSKDQSYFLYGIAAEKLPRLFLPLGESSKKKVRSIAAKLNLAVAEKPESMELCFAGAGDYRAALDAGEFTREGDITDMDGNRLGSHKGIANYTLGQRRGIGFAGGKPLYVGRIDARTNTIALGTKEQVSFRTINANQMNVLVSNELVANQTLFGKIRSYGDPQPCRVIEVEKNSVTVEFDKPQFAPCPGQKLVLYDSKENVVAGGTINTIPDSK